MTSGSGDVRGSGGDWGWDHTCHLQRGQLLPDSGWLAGMGMWMQPYQTFGFFQEKPEIWIFLNVKYLNLGFPGGTVVKNPPANAGDTGSSPGPGRSHMLRSSSARAPQLLSLRSRAREPPLLSPRATTTEARAPRARALQQEKPPQ